VHMMAVVQFRPVRGEVAANLQKLVALAENALRAGAKLVVLPEMAAVGYRFSGRDEVRAIAESLDGRTSRAFSELSARHAAWIVVGLAEAAGSTLYNSAIALGPDGRLTAHFRKRLLFIDDLRWAVAGDLPYPAFPTPWGVATIGICMDLNDPRFTAAIVRRRFEIVCFPTNWIDEQYPRIHEYWLSRLGKWRGTLLAANRWGEEDGVGFYGRSAILRAGRVEAAAPPSGDGWIAVEPVVAGAARPRTRGAKSAGRPPAPGGRA